MLGAEVQHLLDLQHIAGASVSTGLDDKSHEVFELLVLNDLGCFYRSICQVLLSEEEKTKSQSEDPSEGVLEVLLLLLHESLKNALSSVLVACARVDDAYGKRRDSL